MLAKNYTHGGMSNEEFLNHHRAKAREGDPVSRDILRTQNRLEQEELYRQTAERREKESSK